MDTGIYARISSDVDGRSLGVKRQIADCEREANRRGWQIRERFVDNDVSATRSKVRPEYQRMLAAIRDGAIQAVIVWDVDRLTRTPRELEDVIDLADRHGLQLANIGGDIDLSTPQGRMTARIKGSVARHETEQQSKRIRRKFEDKAKAGEPHGTAPYGFVRVYETDDNGRRTSGRNVVEESQAAVVREAAERLIAGESLYAITQDLNARSLPSPRGTAWSTTALRQILKRASNAGLRIHRGQVIGKTNGESIFDENTHDAVTSILSDPERRTGVGGRPKHLMSGIAECGRCGGTVVRAKGARKQDGSFGADAYFCRNCFRLRRSQIDVDAVVEAVVTRRLAQPDAIAALTSGDPKAALAARKQIATLEARQSLAADQFADGDITGAQLKRITAKLTPQIHELHAVINRSAGNDLVASVAGGAGRWRSASLDQKRAVIQALMRVTIMPSGPGKPFDPELIRIEWRS